MRKHLAFLALGAAVVACEPNRGITGLAGAARQAQLDGGATPGAVYTITNQAAGNEVRVFARAADGTLSPAGTYATGGTGTGAGLGSQGAVVLSRDGRWLYAVNAGSNDVTVFSVRSGALAIAGRTPSGGIRPTSVTVHGNIVYVLNAGGDGNITGFTRGAGGALSPIPAATRSLSGTATEPAQVEFSPDGRSLIVTERATNLLDVYPVDADGVAGERTSFASAGGVPFGFAFGHHNLLLVSEAAGPGSASSYVLGRGGELGVVSGAVRTRQGAPCWVVVTNDRRFGYTGNGVGSVSGFAIAPDGSITLLDPDGATALIPGGVNDIALSADGRSLYVLGTGAARAIHAFAVEANGSLTPLGPAGELPAGTQGLAAF